MAGSAVDDCDDLGVVVAFLNLGACIGALDGVIDDLGGLVVVVTLIFVAYADAALIKGSVGEFLIGGANAVAALNVEGYGVFAVSEGAGSAGNVGSGKGALAKIISSGVGVPLALGDGLGVLILCADADELIDKALECLESYACVQHFVVGRAGLFEAGSCVVSGVDGVVVDVKDISRCGGSDKLGNISGGLGSGGLLGG